MGKGMDNVIWFGSDSENSQEELPWLKDWVKKVTDYTIPREVISVYTGDKGLLIETGEYKSFIFRRETVCRFLEEALTHWVTTHEEVQPLIVSANTKGKAQYGLHQDKPKVIWDLDDGKYRSIRIDGKATLPILKSNPFLPSNNPALMGMDTFNGNGTPATNNEGAAPRKGKRALET